MKKKIFIFLFLLLFLSSCSEEKNEETSLSDYEIYKESGQNSFDEYYSWWLEDNSFTINDAEKANFTILNKDQLFDVQKQGWKFDIYPRFSFDYSNDEKILIALYGVRRNIYDKIEIVIGQRKDAIKLGVFPHYEDNNYIFSNLGTADIYLFEKRMYNTTNKTQLVINLIKLPPDWRSYEKTEPFESVKVKIYSFNKNVTKFLVSYQVHPYEDTLVTYKLENSTKSCYSEYIEKTDCGMNFYWCENTTEQYLCQVNVVKGDD